MAEDIGSGQPRISRPPQTPAFFTPIPANFKPPINFTPANFTPTGGFGGGGGSLSSTPVPTSQQQAVELEKNLAAQAKVGGGSLPLSKERILAATQGRDISQNLSTQAALRNAGYSLADSKRLAGELDRLSQNQATALANAQTQQIPMSFASIVGEVQAPSKLQQLKESIQQKLGLAKIKEKHPELFQGVSPEITAGTKRGSGLIGGIQKIQSGVEKLIGKETSDRIAEASLLGIAKGINKPVIPFTETKVVSDKALAEALGNIPITETDVRLVLATPFLSTTAQTEKAISKQIADLTAREVDVYGSTQSTAQLRNKMTGLDISELDMQTQQQLEKASGRRALVQQYKTFFVPEEVGRKPIQVGEGEILTAEFGKTKGGLSQAQAGAREFVSLKVESTGEIEKAIFGGSIEKNFGQETRFLTKAFVQDLEKDTQNLMTLGEKTTTLESKKIPTGGIIEKSELQSRLLQSQGEEELAQLRVLDLQAQKQAGIKQLQAKNIPDLFTKQELANLPEELFPETAFKEAKIRARADAMRRLELKNLKITSQQLSNEMGSTADLIKLDAKIEEFGVIQGERKPFPSQRTPKGFKRLSAFDKELLGNIQAKEIEQNTATATKLEENFRKGLKQEFKDLIVKQDTKSIQDQVMGYARAFPQTPSRAFLFDVTTEPVVYPRTARVPPVFATLRTARARVKIPEVSAKTFIEQGFDIKTKQGAELDRAFELKSKLDTKSELELAQKFEMQLKNRNQLESRLQLNLKQQQRQEQKLLQQLMTQKKTRVTTTTLFPPTRQPLEKKKKFGFLFDEDFKLKEPKFRTRKISKGKTYAPSFAASTLGLTQRVTKKQLERLSESPGIRPIPVNKQDKAIARLLSI